MGIIRILLAIIVVIHHSNAPFRYIHLSAALAVQAFFVISGFYMTLVLKEKYINRNNSYFLFIFNRFLRIYPTYWLILIITIVLSYFWFYNGFQSGFRIYQSHYHYSQNGIFLYAGPIDILRDFTILFRSDYLQINENLRQQLLLGQAWTLIVELLFYLAAPFIVKRIRVIIPLFLVSLSLHFLIGHYTLIHNFPMTESFFPAVLFYFLLGSLSFYLYKTIEKRSISRKISFSITAGFVFLTVIYGYLPAQQIFYIIALSLAIPFIFLYSKKNKFDRLIGELSYPLYLSHTTVFLAISNSPLKSLDRSRIGILTIIMSIAVSVLIVQYFEKYIESWRQSKFKQNKNL